MAARLNAKEPSNNWKHRILGHIWFVGWILLLSTVAQAERPTSGGLFSFSVTDQVTHWETPDGSIRVHYSTDGPNIVRPFDGNGDGIPDYVENVAEIATQALSTFSTLNLLSPVAESSFTILDNGGSGALDFYLVDFGGNSDGHFGIDACDSENRCTGHMVIENDFTGYAYSNYLEGLKTVIPHELFHGVQAAYNQALPNWISEGTAVWAQRRYDLQSRDFRGFANAYLAETDRPLNKPPSGPVPTFAYGTAIWWEFLSLRHGNDFIQELLIAWQLLEEDDAMLNAMVESLQAKGDTMQSAWVDFSSYNLGTGSQAGTLESYPDASRFTGVLATEQARTISTSKRFYPITTSYYLLDHPGGALYWAMAKESANLTLSLFPSAASTNEVGESLDQWSSDVEEPYALSNETSLPAGFYWLAVMNPTTSGNSVYTDICLGSLNTMADCLTEEETSPENEDPDEDAEESSGCQQSPAPSLWILLIGLFICNRLTHKSSICRL